MDSLRLRRIHAPRRTERGSNGSARWTPSQLQAFWKRSSQPFEAGCFLNLSMFHRDKPFP